MSRRAFRLLAVPPVAAMLALLAWAGPGAPGADAADPVIIPLDPAYVELSFPSQQNVGTVPVAIPFQQGAFRYVPARYGGTVTVTIAPQKVATAQVDATLDVEGSDGFPTRTYGTDPNTPAENRLVMTALGGNRYRIQLPHDPGDHATVARLFVYGFQLRPGIDVVPLDPPGFQLRLSDDGPASAEVAQQTVAVSCPPSRPETAGCAPTPPLPAGAQVRVSLPMHSKLRALGLTGLRNSAFALQPRDPQAWPSPLPGTPLPATVGTSDGATATLTIPAGTTPGPYQFTAVVGDSTGQLVSITALDVQVAARPAATAAPGAPSAGAPTSGAAPAVTDEGSGGPSTAALVVALGGAAAVVAVGAAFALVQYRHRHPSRHRQA